MQVQMQSAVWLTALASATVLASTVSVVTAKGALSHPQTSCAITAETTSDRTSNAAIEASIHASRAAIASSEANSREARTLDADEARGEGAWSTADAGMSFDPSAVAIGTAPVNDSCASPSAVITEPGSYPFDATSQGSDPASGSGGCADTANNSVWVRFTAGEGGDFDFSVCGNGGYTPCLNTWSDCGGSLLDETGPCSCPTQSATSSVHLLRGQRVMLQFGSSTTDGTGHRYGTLVVRQVDD